MTRGNAQDFLTPAGRFRPQAWRLRGALAVLLAAPLLASLPGCGERKPAPAAPIHFVTWKPNVPEVWERIYRLFREEHPGIPLVVEVGPHSSTSFHDLLTQKLKNRSPDVDVFLMDVIWPPEFAAAGWALPLDERFPAAERMGFLESTILANTYQGKIYGLPLFIDSGMLYYRKDLLAKYGLEPPATWEELAQQARLIVAGEAREGREIYGFSAQFKQYEGLVCNMLEYIGSNRGSVLDPATGRSAVAAPPAVEAVRFVRDRIIGSVAPRGVLTYQEPESLSLFLQGKAVFHRNWPYAWTVANSAERSTVAGRVGITRLPRFPEGENFSTLGGWQVGISSHTKNPEAAWTFARFLAGPRVQKLLATVGGRAPTRASLYRDPEIVAATPQLVDMVGVFVTAQPRPRSPLYPSISNVLQRYFSTALSRPDSDIEGEAAAAAREIDRIVEMTR